MREVSPQNTICIDSQPSRPDAAIVGKPGASGDGCALVTASARNEMREFHRGGYM